MDSNRGWDTTSDEDDGMEIDLDAKQDDGNDPKRSEPEEKELNSQEDSQADGLDYDPAEPTDDYDPCEPTPDADSNKLLSKEATLAPKAQEFSLVADYDPAEPTLSEEEKDDENDDTEQTKLDDSNNDEEKKGGLDITNEDDSLDGRWDSQLETLSPEDRPSNLPEETDSGSECVKDVETPTKTESHGKDISQEENEMEKEEEEKSDVEGTSTMNIESKTSVDEGSGLPNGSRSPSLAPTDTDDNTQMSFADGANSDVPEVTIDESDFVLEKELFEPPTDQNVSQEPLQAKSTDRPILGFEDKDFVDSEASQGHENREEEQSEKNRRQEEVDSRNEEALVDLFREESDPDKIENDLEQPLKKTKKKVGTKKIKKKGKKLKKGQSKKGQSKQGGPDVEDQRFVELRGDRHSIESREEGEVDAGGHGGPVSNWGELEDRLASGIGSSEQLYDLNSGNISHPDGREDGEQREPGEIVEEGTKRKGGKKRDREKKRKKKSRREVATIEEGVQGDEDSQKFPSFLAGFFVQDEDGGEDIADKIENISHSYEAEGDRTFQKGGKTYRKRHDSGAEDSVKSGEDALEGLTGQEVRTEEVDHRKGRSHEERRHSSREHRHHDSRDAREGRREKENRHGTPRDKEREKVRDRDRGRHERERVRDRENRDREVVRDRDRERERSRRGEREERRRRHTSRSGSRERRRRSGSAERNRRSRSRERALRHRRHRSRTQERDRDRERVRRPNRDRSRERESERRGSGRRASHSRSRSPRHRSERGSSNKENREESRNSRRRVVSRTHQEGSGSEEREGHRLSHRRQRRERERDRDRERERGRSSSSSSSSSSNSSSSSSSEPAEATSHRQHRSHRDQYSHDYISDREHHHRDYHHHEQSSSDEGASSDVILVEPEKIVINLDEEEDPPSRVDITHANAEDDSTTMVDGESIPPPPDLRQNTRASALIEITQEAAVSSVAGDQAEEGDQEEGDATPTRDERSDEVASKQSQDKRYSAPEAAAEVGEYDPAHPTEEPEDRDSQPPVPAASSDQAAPAPPLPSAQTEQLDAGPVPPSHPPPQEIRPSPPPVPAMPEPSIPQQMAEGPRGLRPQLTPNQFPNPPFPQPHLPPLMLGQQPRFPPTWNMSNNRPNGPGVPGFPNNQRGLLPTPDTQPLFPLGEDVRHQTPFSSLQGRRENQMNQNQPPVPISAMAPLAQLTSLLPALERAKMSSHQNTDGGNSSQGFKEQSFSAGPLMKTPLMSNPGPNLRASRGGRGGTGDASESTEVIDMDMSPGEDDCELELPSPHTSDSDRDDRRRKGRKSDSHTSRAASDMSKGAGAPGGKTGGPIQPVVYLKALRKVIERMTPKGQPSAPGGGGSTQDKTKSQERRRRRPVEMSAEDDVPASAVELTNKEKYLKKLHLQERVIDEVKLAIKPFYSSKKINKEQYKLILRKAVPKVCHSKSERINPQKIQQLVEAYVGKLAKGSTLGGGHTGHSGKRKKGISNSAPQNKDGPGGAASHVIRQNGERGKKSNR